MICCSLLKIVIRLWCNLARHLRHSIRLLRSVSQDFLLDISRDTVRCGQPAWQVRWLLSWRAPAPYQRVRSLDRHKTEGHVAAKDDPVRGAIVLTALSHTGTSRAEKLTQQYLLHTDRSSCPPDWNVRAAG